MSSQEGPGREGPAKRVQLDKSSQERIQPGESRQGGPAKRGSSLGGASLEGSSQEKVQPGRVQARGVRPVQPGEGPAWGSPGKWVQPGGSIRFLRNSARADLRAAPGGIN